MFALGIVELGVVVGIRPPRVQLNSALAGHAGLMLDRSLSRNRLGSGQGRASQGRRVLDLAEGILIGLRRYSAEAAFGELVAVAHRHDTTVSAAASALVELATGGNDPADFHRVVVAIAQHEWGSMLLASRGGRASG